MVIYLDTLSKSQVGMVHPDFANFGALHNDEVHRAVELWVNWIEQGSIQCLKDEDKEKHKLVARFLGLPAANQEALQSAPAVKAVPLLKITHGLKSKLTPVKTNGHSGKSLPIRSEISTRQSAFCM